jgi:hypothetical protein
MPLIVIGLSHHSSPVVVRERFAFAEARIPSALQSLRDSGVAAEAVILSTCNRVEIYAVTPLEPPGAFTALQEFLVSCHDYRDPLGNEIYALGEPQSLHHLFKVASGLDSMVLGETEILGQLKKAYDLAATPAGGSTRPSSAPSTSPNISAPKRIFSAAASPSARLRSSSRRRSSVTWATAKSWSSAPAIPARRPPAPCSPVALTASWFRTARTIKPLRWRPN